MASGTAPSPGAGRGPGARSALFGPGLLVCAFGAMLLATGIDGRFTDGRSPLWSNSRDPSVPWLDAALRGEGPPWPQPGAPLAWLDLVLLGVFSVNAGLVLCHRVVRPGPGDLWGRLLHTVSQAVLAAGMIKFVHFGDWMSRPHPAGSPPVDDTQAYTALGVCLVAGLIGLAGYGLCGIMPLIRAEAGITETNHE
ncbi:hypothetical protein [Streptomyces sp. NPDC058252]|uniref:hypothetical protein n=1 Tax=Streptomyces sp. NPDC058252 TaxID=3346405 RepID=UPI0036DFCD5C